MLKPSTELLNPLLDRPEAQRLARSLQRLLDQRGKELEFIVVFGSMARGDWSSESDWDIFVGLRADDGKRLIERIGEFSGLLEGRVEVFPYSRSEWQRMFEQLHSLFLEVLEYGIVLWDRGTFAQMRRTFRQWRENGRVTPWRFGWKITEA